MAGCETGYEGIYVFDGSRFLSPQGAQNGAGVRGMAEDAEGGIWLSSNQGLLRIYQGKLAKVFAGSALAGITRVAPDVFLLTMQTQGQSSGKADIIRVTKTSAGWKIDSLLTNVGDVQFRLDAAGNLLYGCLGGFCELSAEDVVRWKPGQKLAVHEHALGLGDSYSGGSSIVLRDRRNCIWFRNSTEAAYQCRGEAKPIKLDSAYVSMGYPQLYELNDGAVLIPGFSKIAIGRPEKMEVTNFYACGVVVPLRDGGLIASDGKGLTYLPRRLNVEYWSTPEGLQGNTWSIARNRQHTYVQDDETTRTLDADRKTWRSLQSPAGSMMPENDGNMLVVQGDTIYRMTPGWHELGRSQIADLKGLIRLSDNNIWAVGDVLYRIDTGNGKPAFEPDNAVKIVPGTFGINEDANGVLWACGAYGLMRRANSTWQQVPTENASADAGCISLAIAPNGSIWYSDRGRAAIYYVEQSAGKAPIARVAPTAGETGGIDNMIAVDKRGWVWRGNAEGLYVADPQQARQGKWIHLGATDGLHAVNSNKDSFLEDSDGSIWFGADYDVIHFFVPGDLVHPAFTPSVSITGFSSSDHPLLIDETDTKFPSGSTVTAHLGSLQFDRRQSLHMQYRLLPGDGAWMAASSFDLPLGKLSWGSHTLQLQGQVGDGPWSRPVEQAVTVMVPAALAWPALGSYAIAGIGAGFAGFQWRRRRRAKLRRGLPDLTPWRLAALSPEFQSLEGKLLDDRFRVGPILARGGFALVADGHDESQGNLRCAIKVFYHDAVDREWIGHRFRHEVRALEQLNHPNVVRIYGSGVAPNGSFYLVMEFIEGTTLRAVIDQGPIPPRQIARYLRQAGSALDAVHRCGIYHRDVKPENLMLRDGAANGQDLVLIDFSIAIVKDPDKTVHGLSRAAGTIGYMAPEQAIGFAHPATDIYSLAKVLIEMITGTRLAALLPDASMDLPERMRELIPSLPVRLSAESTQLFSSAFEFDPVRRPANVGEFADRIAGDLESD
ncbi:protein kinase domain-containing protein [Terracidiphilus sp.]|uniref:serine/threonine-protein kinase n=1 Tax=Terracidiphilus sp. TaxID=1964191 RepID=UPI003C21E7D0